MDITRWLTLELLRLARIKARAVARRDRLATTVLTARMTRIAETIEEIAR